MIAEWIWVNSSANDIEPVNKNYSGVAINVVIKQIRVFMNGYGDERYICTLYCMNRWN